MNSTWKAILGVIAVFIFGWLAGVLSASVFIGHRAMALYRGGPAAVEQLLEKRLTRGVGLDATQRQQIHGYVMENVNQRLQLQKQLQPQIRALNQQTLKEIDAVLRPEQAEKFHANLDYFRMHAGRSFFNPGGEDSPAAPATNSASPSGK